MSIEFEGKKSVITPEGVFIIGTYDENGTPNAMNAHDIARVAGRRTPGIQMVLRPAQLQGAGAAEDIARGIRELSQIPGIDVLIIGRGGGSLEDLWAFNEEIVVRAVSECPIPVISAVGHETDVTLSDFAADVRAATPSAAAELAVPERAQLQDQLLSLRARALKAAHDTLRVCFCCLDNGAVVYQSASLTTSSPAFTAWPSLT